MFGANNGVFGEELWISDRTPAGTRVVRRINARGRGSSPTLLTPFRGRMLFAADDGTHGREPWVSDGTAPGTVLLKDINPGTPSAGPLSTPVLFRGQLYFFALDTGGLALWRTDGSTNGTVRITGLARFNFLRVEVVVANDRLFFLAGNDLWVSDGTAAGTARLRTFQPSFPFGVSPHSLTRLKSVVFFVTEDNGRVELWRSDGTGPGTVQFTNEGTRGAVPHDLAVAGDSLFFAARQAATGDELWKTDGTKQGTKLVADIAIGSRSSTPRPIIASGKRVFLLATQSVSRSLFVSDGTAAGTRHLLAGARDVLSMTAFGAGILFSHVTPAAGREPWLTDGTSLGTRMIADLWRGTDGSIPAPPTGRSSFGVVGSGRIALFAADDGATGVELWRTDGTGAGTKRIGDISDGPGSSSPLLFARLGSLVMFDADDYVRGRELWRMPLAATGDSLAAPFGAGCAGSGNRVPVLSAVGLPRLGNATFALRTTDARANSAGVLLLGRRQSLSLGACTLHVALPAIALAFPTDGLGVARLPLPIPNAPSLRGLEAILQAAIIDPNGKLGGVLALTRAVHMVIGE